MPGPFRLAIVGAGMITRESHLPVALASTRVKVVAIVEPARWRAEELARAYGIAPKIVPHVQDVLKEVDGIIVATPNDTHMEIAIACLEMGVATLIEKPLASTYHEGEAIVLAGKKHGAVVSVGYVTRFRDNVLLLGELLKKNYFGKVRRFAHQFGTNGGWAPMSSYNLSRTAAGGGVLVVTGTHFLDRMLHFWGYPDAIEFVDDSQGGPEANCRATFRYVTAGSQYVGFALYSKTARLPGGLVIETDQGVVQIDDTRDAEILFYPEHSTVFQVVRRCGKPPYDPRLGDFQRQLEDFVAASQQGRPPMVDGTQGLESLRLIEELYTSREAFPALWKRPVVTGKAVL